MEGAELGSGRLVFRTGAVAPGPVYELAVGTAGSATLVVQTVLPALLVSGAACRVVLEGGTHNPFAPPFEFLERAFVPLLRRMGARVEVRLERHGFYPAGGGRFVAEVAGGGRLEPLELLERGEVRRRRVRGVVSNLPRRIAEEECAVVCEALGWPAEAAEVEEVASDGPGNAVLAEVGCDGVTEVFTAFGRRGVPARRVGAELAREVRAYLEAGAPVGPHLADQLLIPLALAGGGRFRTVEPTAHMRTNAEVVERFLPVRIGMEEDRGAWVVWVEGRG